MSLDGRVTTMDCKGKIKGRRELAHISLCFPGNIYRKESQGPEQILSRSRFVLGVLLNVADILSCFMSLCQNTSLRLLVQSVIIQTLPFAVWHLSQRINVCRAQPVDINLA
jgi:hypothetical protein